MTTTRGNGLTAINSQPAKTQKQETNGLNCATLTRNSKAESTLISALERARHVVHVGRSNDYTVCKYGYSYYAQDFAALNAFAVRLGVCHG
jgi:hypothetical protein